jgi:hypothetical protein
VLGGVYDNFTIYVMVSNEGLAPGKAPLSYQVIYRRNINGTTGFAKGTPYFEIVKHTSSSDTSLGKVGVPEGFIANEWHDFQIQTFDGKVGFILDGQKLISVDDGQYKSGGVGFGGINATVYLDDIQIISNPKYVDYAPDLGLGNAVLNGNFNPNYYTYYAAITDAEKPITIQKPHIVLDGAEIKLQLNGEEIPFVEGSASISPDQLVKGKNVLILSEISSAGSKDYFIYMNKDYEIISIEGMEDNVSTTVDHAPNLPKEVTVIFKDGVSQVAKVNWDTVNPSFYKNPGTFTVKGQLIDLKGSVSVNVTVDGITSIDKLGNVTTLAGVAPELAAKVKAQYLNNMRELPLTFAPLDTSLYAKEGTIIAVGTAEGYEGDILQVVEVQDNHDPKPILTAGTANRLTETTASVSFNTSKDGQYYYKVVDSGAKMPVMDTSKPGIPSKKGLVLISIEGLKTTTANDVYIVVKNGDVVSDVLKMEIPKYTVESGYTLVIGNETAGGVGYTRDITIGGGKGNDLTSKYLVVQFTEGTGVNAKVSVVMIAPQKNVVSISYQKQGAKIDTWLTSGMPNLMEENMGVEIFANAKSN